MVALPASGQYVWVNPSNGDWEQASNWSPTGIPDGVGTSAVLPDFQIPYEVSIQTIRTADSLNIESPDTTLVIQGESTLIVASEAGLLNNGVIRLTSSNTAAYDGEIRFDSVSGESILHGAGSILLDFWDAALRVRFGTTLSLMQPVYGAGNIYAEGLLVNHSMIRATDVPPGASYRTIELFGNIQQTPDASLSGETWHLFLNEATVTGGQITGGVAVRNNVRLSGVHLTGENIITTNGELYIQSGGIRNDGILSINPSGSTLEAWLIAEAECTVSGVGEIRLRAPEHFSDAGIVTNSGGKFVFEEGQTIRGSGFFQTAHDTSIVVRGSIIADQPGEEFVLAASIDLEGVGRIISDQGEISLGAQISNGQLEGDVRCINVGERLINCVNNGNLYVQNARLAVSEGLVNNGEIFIDTVSVFSMLEIETDCAITGSGVITLPEPNGSFTWQRLRVSEDVTASIGSGQVVRGAGQIEVLGTMMMDGVYRADIEGKLLVLTGEHDLSGGGRIEAVGGGVIGMQEADITNGEFYGRVEVMRGLTLRGQTTNHGTLGVTHEYGSEIFNIRTHGDIINNGTIYLVGTSGTRTGYLTTVEPVEIRGTGQILLDGNNAGLTRCGGCPGGFDLAQGQTVRGQGRLTGPITMRGLLDVGLDESEPGLVQSTRLTLTPTSRVVLDIQGEESFDRVTAHSTIPLELGGTIELRLQNGYVPTPGTHFLLIDFATDDYATFVAPVIDNHSFRVVEGSAGFEVVWACRADVNLDGTLSPADFSAWIAAFNTHASGCDQNGDGECTPADFTAWISNYNMGC